MGTAIVSGIISGLISTGIIYFLLFKWKLRFSISPQISKSPNDGDWRIKIVNLSRAHAVNLNYSISICIRGSDNIAHIIPVQLVKMPITDIQKYQAGVLSDYAIRIAFRFDEKVLGNPSAKILFKCYATHAISGTVSFFIKNILKMTSYVVYLKLENL